jgi:phosphatidate cytidylyltransferase
MGTDFFDEELMTPEPEPEQDPERPPGRRRPERRKRRGRRKEPREPRRRRRPSGGGETAKRILVALPWIAFAIAITIAGGIVFALAMIAIGVVCLGEFFAMTKGQRTMPIPAYLAVAALIVAAHFGTAFNVLLIVAATFPVLFAFGARAPDREGVTVSIAATLMGILWIGIPLAHAVLLRDLPHHGAALLVDVLVGTFVTDTAAYATGRMFGSHKIAPSISPNKTIEGLIGGFVIGTMGFWFAGLYQNWLTGADALIIGAAVAAAAPIGDLFESMLKRDLGTKDTGTLFGPHGGILDRLDAVFFTVVVGYYLAVALVY